MAAVAVTGRRKSTHGAMKVETGTFIADADGADFFVVTKLRRVRLFRFTGTTGSDITGTYVLNSSNGTNVASGTVFFDSGYAGDEPYHYIAMGKG